MWGRIKLGPASSALWGLLLILGLSGCAHTPPLANDAQRHALQAALTSLAPTVRSNEAARVTACAFDYSRILAERYRAVRPALLHNFLVNTGRKQRGLCYEWAEDLVAELQTLELDSLQLRWGIARAETVREHNSVVVTARGQPFAEGIILDAWRRSGQLIWAPVRTDRYPWVEGELNATPPPTNSSVVIPAVPKPSERPPSVASPRGRAASKRKS